MRSHCLKGEAGRRRGGGVQAPVFARVAPLLKTRDHFSATIEDGIEIDLGAELNRVNMNLATHRLTRSQVGNLFGCVRAESIEPPRRFDGITALKHRCRQWLGG